MTEEFVGVGKGVHNSVRRIAFEQGMGLLFPQGRGTPHLAWPGEPGVGWGSAPLPTAGMHLCST